MKFYSINSSLDKKILGNYPQVKDVKHNCHIWDSPNFIDRLSFKNIDFEPITSNAILYAKSNLTDLINVSSIGFSRKLLISNKLKLILEANQNKTVGFYKSNLIKKEKEIKDYWIVNPIESKLEYIDFEKSSIYLMKNYSTRIKQLSISNYDEYLQENANANYPFSLIITSFKIRQKIEEQFFVLSDVLGGIKYLVSDKLKAEIEDSNCLGIEFQPTELELNEWLNSNERIEKYGKY